MKIESYFNAYGTTCWGLYGSDSKKYKNTTEFEDLNLSWYNGALGNGKGWRIPLSKLEAVKAWLVKINSATPANNGELAELQKQIKELKEEQKIFKKKIKVLKDFASSKKKSLVVDDEGDFSMQTDESSDEE